MHLLKYMYLVVLAVVDITQELIDESQQMICESTITRITFEFNITYVFIVSWSFSSLSFSMS